MEKTLIRNLSDHLGNNLLHIVCRHGHASVLPWLAARLGPELDSALSDENKQGLTPIVLAIKVRERERVKLFTDRPDLTLDSWTTIRIIFMPLSG